jgi:hypothetical protein
VLVLLLLLPSPWLHVAGILAFWAAAVLLPD